MVKNKVVEGVGMKDEDLKGKGVKRRGENRGG